MYPRSAALVLAATLLGASTADAELIEADFQTPGDRGVTRDTETGLEWLDLTYTLGGAWPAQPTAELGAEGWRHAATPEVCDLFDHSVGPLPSCPTGGPAVTSRALAQQLIGLFGPTHFTPPDAYESGGLFEDGNAADPLVGAARVADPGAALDPYGFVSVAVDAQSPAGDPELGHFLVRPFRWAAIVWTATTGSGQPGSAVIAAETGDELTAELRLRVGGEGIQRYGVSVRFDTDLGDELDLLEAVELLPPGFTDNATPGPLATSESVPGQAGSVLHFEAFAAGGGPADVEVAIATLRFQVKDAVSDGDDVVPALVPASGDELVDNSGGVLADTTHLFGARVDAPPPPPPAPNAVAQLSLRVRGAPPLALSGSGVAVRGAAGAHLTSLQVLEGFAGGTGSVPVTDSTVSPDGLWVKLEARLSLGSGALTGLPGGGAPGGALPLRGLMKVCLIDPNCLPGGFVPIFLTQHSPASSTRGVGIGGELVSGGLTPRVTLEANPWTLATASALDDTASGALVAVRATGFAHGPASLTSSTAAPSGVVQLVTPLQISSDLPAAGIQLIGMTAAARVRFVPEPGRLTMLVAGALALAWLGVRRRLF